MRSLSPLEIFVAPAKAGAYDHNATPVGPGFRRGRLFWVDDFLTPDIFFLGCEPFSPRPDSLDP